MQFSFIFLQHNLQETNADPQTLVSQNNQKKEIFGLETILNVI